MSYQDLMTAIAQKLGERLAVREAEMRALAGAIADSGRIGRVSDLELMARARLGAVNSQIAKLSKAIASIADAAGYEGRQ